MQLKCINSSHALASGKRLLFMLPCDPWRQKHKCGHSVCLKHNFNDRSPGVSEARAQMSALSSSYADSGGQLCTCKPAVEQGNE
jgi:hypothetical protein